MDPARTRRVQNTTIPRQESGGYTQRGAKGELLTGQASMVEYLLDNYHHHGWDSKLGINHPELLFLATHDQLANFHDPIT